MAKHFVMILKIVFTGDCEQAAPLQAGTKSNFIAHICRRATGEVGKVVEKARPIGRKEAKRE